MPKDDTLCETSSRIDVVLLGALAVLGLTPAYVDTSAAHSYFGSLFMDGWQTLFRGIVVAQIIFVAGLRMFKTSTLEIPGSVESGHARNDAAPVRVGMYMMLVQTIFWMVGLYALGATTELKVCGIVTAWCVIHLVTSLSIGMFFYPDFRQVKVNLMKEYCESD
jgi:uncharacterized membrane protein